MIEKAQPHDHLDEVVAQPGEAPRVESVPPTRVGLQAEWASWLVHPTCLSTADALTAR